MSSTTSIGERLRAVRQGARQNQDAFAAALGSSKRSLVSWELGSAEPPIGILPKLRELYDVDPEWMVMGDGQVPVRHFGPADWERFDRLRRDVAKVCVDVGLKLPAERTEALARVLYDAGGDAGPANRQQLRGTLLALSLGERE